MEVSKAIARYVQIAPRKLRIVIDIIRGKAVDQAHLEPLGLGQLLLLCNEFRVVTLGGINGRTGEQRIETSQPFAIVAVRAGTLGFLVEVFADVAHDLCDALWR